MEEQMKRVVVASSLLSLVLASTASASPIGPVFPPPGGVTVTNISGTGAGFTGGITRSYTALDPIGGDYSALWFGISNLFLPLSSPAGGPGTSQAVNSAPIISGNSALWTAASLWSIPVAGGSTSATVQFRLTVWDFFGAPVNLGSFGLSGSEGAELNVTPLLANGFRARIEFLANGIGVLDFFNNPNLDHLCQNAQGPSGCVQTSVNGSFWYEANQHDSAVPEPASLALMGSGLLVGVRKLRRRRA